MVRSEMGETKFTSIHVAVTSSIECSQVIRRALTKPPKTTFTSEEKKKAQLAHSLAQALTLNQ